MRGLSSVRIGSVAFLVASWGIGGGPGQRPAMAQLCPDQFVGMPAFAGDADIAVGKSHVPIIDHDRIRAFDKCGNTIFGPLLIDGPNSTPGFFTLPGSTTAGAKVLWSLGDPEVFYDPQTGRFWAVGMRGGFDGSGAPLGSYVAVSGVTEDATNWPESKKYEVTYLGACVIGFYDMLSLGISNNDVWLSALIVASDEPTACPGSFTPQWESYSLTHGTRTSLESGGSQAFQHAFVPSWAAYLPVPARKATVDSTPQYMVGRGKSSPTSGNEIALWPLLFSGGQIVDPAPLKYTITAIPTYYNTPATINQPVPGKPINMVPSQVDSRIWSAVYSNGSLWFTHLTGDATHTRSLVRVYEVLMNGWTGGTSPVPVLNQVITFDPYDLNPTTPPALPLNAYVPSVSAQPNGLAAVTYNVVGSGVGPGHFMAVRMSYRCPSDTLGTMRAPWVLYSAGGLIGQNWSGGAQLGNTDYSGTMIDPRIAGRFWTHHGRFPVGQNGVGAERSDIKRFDPPCGLDFNGDGMMNVADTATFQQSLAAGQPESDFNPNGEPDTDDVTQFIDLSEPK